MLPEVFYMQDFSHLQHSEAPILHQSTETFCSTCIFEAGVNNRNGILRRIKKHLEERNSNYRC